MKRKSMHVLIDLMSSNVVVSRRPQDENRLDRNMLKF